MKNRIVHILRWTNILLVLFTLVSYLAPFINPQDFWPAVFLSLTYPTLLFLNLIFVALWIWRKKRHFIFSLGCILLGWTYFTSFVGLSSVKKSSPKVEESLKVMTFNAYQFRYFYGKDPKYKTSDSKQSITDFYRFLKEEKVDVLCLQESMSRRVSHVFFKEVNEVTDLPYQYEHPDKSLIIFSKYPIEKKGILGFGKGSNGGHFADINIKNKRIRVYNLHLRSNRISGYTNKLAKEHNLKNKETWTDIEDIMRLYKRAAVTRVQQVAIVKEHVNQSPHPVVVCGDFNDTPQSYVYRQIARNLCDGFKEKGAGLGISFAGTVPALRIDYILNSPELEVTYHKIFKRDYSDHYPVLSGLGL